MDHMMKSAKLKLMSIKYWTQGLSRFLTEDKERREKWDLEIQGELSKITSLIICKQVFNSCLLLVLILLLAMVQQSHLALSTTYNQIERVLMSKLWNRYQEFCWIMIMISLCLSMDLVLNAACPLSTLMEKLIIVSHWMAISKIPMYTWYKV